MVDKELGILIYNFIILSHVLFQHFRQVLVAVFCILILQIISFMLFRFSVVLFNCKLLLLHKHSMLRQILNLHLLKGIYRLDYWTPHRIQRGAFFLSHKYWKLMDPNFPFFVCFRIKVKGPILCFEQKKVRVIRGAHIATTHLLLLYIEKISDFNVSNLLVGETVFDSSIWLVWNFQFPSHSIKRIESNRKHRSLDHSNLIDKLFEITTCPSEGDFQILRLITYIFVDISQINRFISALNGDLSNLFLQHIHRLPNLLIFFSTLDDSCLTETLLGSLWAEVL